VKFLCVECDEVMALQERQLPGDGTLAAIYLCSGCTREIALLTNPMETRIVSSMGVKIGGRTVPEQPMETVRTNLEGGRDDAFDAAPEASEPPVGSAPPEPEGAATPGTADPEPRPDAPRPAASRPRSRRVEWSPAALDRLERVPRFVRGMVKRIYTEYARENGIEVFTPELMDQARTELGLEGM